MPRVSDTHLAARRAEIIAGARRCFADFGYEGATVRQLERTVGLSRGAIFHHFPDKETLFFAVAQDNAAHMAQIIAESGLIGVMRDLIAHHPSSEGVDPSPDAPNSSLTSRPSPAPSTVHNATPSARDDGLRIQLEVTRRVRTDPRFAKRWEPVAREMAMQVRVRLERGVAAGSVRNDVPIEVIERYLELTFDGLIAHLAAGKPADELHPVLDLVEDGVQQ